MDTLELRLVKPDLTPSTLASLFVAPKAVAIPADQPTAQISVGAVSTSGKTYNVTSSVSGTGYTMENPVVASIGAEGLVTGLAGGNTMATASNSDKTASAPITVEIPPAITAIDVPTPYVTLKDPGAAQQLNILGLLSNGGTQNITLSPGTQFSSSDPAVASVDSSGNLVANGEGTATITITNGDYTTSVKVAVEFRVPPTVTALQLLPIEGPVTTSDGRVLVQAKLSGTGSLEQLGVSFALAGAASIQRTIFTDYLGIAMDQVSGLNNPGSVTVTASIADPSSGTVFTDSKSFTVEAANRDSEPNNEIGSATRIDKETSIEGFLDGAADPKDVYRLRLTTSGRLVAKLSLPEGIQLGNISMAVMSANGNELARLTASTFETSLSADVSPGDNFIAVESSGTQVFYKLTTVFDQSPVTVASVTPTSGSTGILVTIRGSGFSIDPGENLVMFGSIAGKLVSASATELQVRVPTNAVDASLEVIAGSQGTSGPDFSTGNPGPSPDISLTPSDPEKVRYDPVLRTLTEVNRLLVKFDPEATRTDVENLASSFGGTIVGFLPNFNTYDLEFSGINSLGALARIQGQIEKNPIVISALRNAFMDVDQERHSPSSCSSLDRHEIDTRDGVYRYGPKSYYPGMAYLNAGVFYAVEYARYLAYDCTETLAKYSKNVKVAIIDTGFNPKRLDEFSNNQISFLRVGCPPKWMGSCGIEWFAEFEDPHGHGTWMTSIIAALNNKTDLSGVINSLYRFDEDAVANQKIRIMVYGVPDYTTGKPCLRKTLAALDHIKKNSTIVDPINIVSMSFGSAFVTINNEYWRRWDSYREKFQSLSTTTLVVISAGNDGIVANHQLPATLWLTSPNVISIGAVAVSNLDGTGELADERAIFGKLCNPDDDTLEHKCGTISKTIYDNSTHRHIFCDEQGNRGSNCGPGVNLAAPGEDVLVTSIWGKPDYHTINGTSPATAMVAGIAALMQTIRRTDKPITPSDLRKILIETGDSITDRWNNGRYRVEGELLGRLKQGLDYRSENMCRVNAYKAAYRILIRGR
jgi:hypothetical protein